MNKDLQHKMLDELIDNAKPMMHKMMDNLINSGALTDEFKEDNYLLAKVVITIWGSQGHYAPLYDDHRKELENLKEFV